MAANAFQWHSERLTPRRTFGVLELDSISALNDQLHTLTKQLGAMTANFIHIPHTVCELCSGNHSSMDCQVDNLFAASSFGQVSYVGNYNHQNDLYSNTYNQGYHPNFSWRENQTSSFEFQPQEKKVSLEEALAQLTMNTSNFMTKTETTLENQATSIQNLEVKVSQMVKVLTEEQQSSLPRSTEINPKEQVMVITLQSEEKLIEPNTNMEEALQMEASSSKSSSPKKYVSPPPYVPPIPFPQRLGKSSKGLQNEGTVGEKFNAKEDTLTLDVVGKTEEFKVSDALKLSCDEECYIVGTNEDVVQDLVDQSNMKNSLEIIHNQHEKISSNQSISENKQLVVAVHPSDNFSSFPYSYDTLRRNHPFDPGKCLNIYCDHLKPHLDKFGRSVMAEFYSRGVT
ncbi:DNA-directed DNA polymerase [Melia azedarach]|uniref:DNA-directed DNA polymerase n=1 Tax=Melia azedarach TaxID=155640 RepID=A0ACC1XQ41_MELAZ|nr:DNA-directed DNA polymerase [Melia azedarach]